MTGNDQIAIPVLLDNAGTQDTAAFLTSALRGAERLDICTGYISRVGLAQLGTWLASMPSDARVRLLVGMEPARWQYMGRRRTDEAGRAFLRQHLRQGDGLSAAEAQDVCQYLGQQARGCLAVKVRLGQTPDSHAAGQLHAKLYRAQGPALDLALVSSSNLTGGGLAEQGELNMRVADAETLHTLDQWFETAWHHAASFGPQAILGPPQPGWMDEQAKTRTELVAEPMPEVDEAPATRSFLQHGLDWFMKWGVIWLFLLFLGATWLFGTMVFDQFPQLGAFLQGLF